MPVWRARCSAAADVATPTTSRPSSRIRRAISRRAMAVVDPVPRPSRIPLSTRPAAARAAASLAASNSGIPQPALPRSEEHTSELQSRENLVCRLLLEKKNSLNTLCQELDQTQVEAGEKENVEDEPEAEREEGDEAALPNPKECAPPTDPSHQDQNRRE